MYQDTDFGKDVLAGVALQAEADNLKIVASLCRGSAACPGLCSGRHRRPHVAALEPRLSWGMYTCAACREVLQVQHFSGRIPASRN